jgi:hypothetical protein
MKLSKRTWLLGTGGVVAIAAASLTIALMPASASNGDVSAARKATAKYHDISAAVADKFGKLVDKKGIACIDDPAGGMGIHYVNKARVGDASEIASQPEVVIYEPQKNGSMKLVAVEYVVIKSDWEKAGNTAAPRLYGRDFELQPATNRYGLPPFYELHAWIWQHNSNGMNDDWNPKVSCQFA